MYVDGLSMEVGGKARKKFCEKMKIHVHHDEESRQEKEHRVHFHIYFRVYVKKRREKLDLKLFFLLHFNIYYLVGKDSFETGCEAKKKKHRRHHIYKLFQTFCKP